MVWFGTAADAAGHNRELEVSQTLTPAGSLPVMKVYVLHDITQHAELSRLREEFLYNVAHELRGPLAVLDNALDIITTSYGELSADELDRLLRTARHTASRLHNLMENLLSAGAIQAGRLQVHPLPMKLQEILTAASEAMEALLAERGQLIDWFVPSRTVWVMADQRYAYQVLANLLNNASKYSAYGERIQVLVDDQQPLVRISVVDRGPGIPPEQQVGLFDRYYRARPANDQPGVGLGLAIAKGIVEAHGGAIGVESEVGMGTKVWFTLPSARGDV